MTQAPQEQAQLPPHDTGARGTLYLEFNGLVMSPAVGALQAALAKAQGAMRAAPKNRVNPHFKNRYADLDAVKEAARVPLSENGLAVTQWPATRGKSVSIITMLGHASGEWILRELVLDARDGAPQSVGSAITYGLRYGFCAAVGMTADEDDDGEEPRAKGKGKPAAAASAEPRYEPDADSQADRHYMGTEADKEVLRAAFERHGIHDNRVKHAVAAAMKGKRISELETTIAVQPKGVTTDAAQ